ncbi:MAG: BsuPI-related putative proteinase inhibitor [Chloroflexi bacterium]|nr:BsuPI-related putative proteinase inhibitor [Chloroflexota bacterium]
MHQANRRVSPPTGELTRSVSRARWCYTLRLTAVVLTLCVLVTLGCTTETPPVGSPVPSPRSSKALEATHLHTGTAWHGSTEEEPSVAQLRAWYRAVEEEAAGQVRGIVWSGVDGRNRRIEFGLVPLRGDREQLEAAIARAKVPREAIDIEVGCQGGALRRIEYGAAPSEELRRAIDYSLETVSQADYGETVSMKLTLKNSSDQPVQFYTGRPPHDFVVATVHGQEVWHWRCGKTFQAILEEINLEPGEELVLVGEWEQMDNWGEPVPAGTYLIRGMLVMEPAGILATPPQELEVLE